jgi:hypothetical protein
MSETVSPGSHKRNEQQSSVQSTTRQVILSVAINTVTLKNKKILLLNFESFIFIRLFIVFSHFGANILYNMLRY